MTDQSNDKLPEKKEPEQQKTGQEASKETEKKPEDDEDDINKINWKRFREQREVERKARIDAEKKAQERAAEVEALKAALESSLNKKSSMDNSGFNQTIQTAYDSDANPDSETDRVKRLVSEEINRYRQDDQKRMQAEEQRNYPIRLRQEMPDFDKVCSQDNLDWLEFHHPEITAPYSHMPEGYQKWALLYRATKKFIPNHDSKKDEKRAERNLAKPASMSIPGATQSGDGAPTRTTEEQRRANWARMVRTMKGLG